MAKKFPNPTPADAKWFDHQQLNFWLWACLRDASNYLDISRESDATFKAIFSSPIGINKEASERHGQLKNEQDLAAYHFTVTMGNLLRLLSRAQHLFPAIQPSYSQARHLLTEGKGLRDMIEHAHGNDGYLVGNGREQENFVRDDAPRPGITVDAISTIIDESGHWLGGRLCVEKVIEEVTPIYDVAREIPPPEEDGTA
ncbi:hypothetical protein KV699_07250 [Vreelandella titanicae]|uniref:hypothetical protein n=1 Tax=Vreelandella titanicae TaxID=664683 RepID=UPI003BB0016B